MRKKKKNFTIVELLVVIAIMIILASLLFPALGKAKGIVKTNICSGNLKNLYFAEIGYIGDYNDWFTPCYPGKDTNGETSFWTNILYTYLGGNGDTIDDFRKNVDPVKSVYFCPSQILTIYKGSTYIANYPSYGLNVSIGGMIKSSIQSVKLVKVNNPSRTGIFADVQYDLTTPGLGKIFLQGYYTSPRHPKPDEVNLVYIDGHVSRGNYNKLRSSGDYDVLARSEFSYNWP